MTDAAGALVQAPPTRTAPCVVAAYHRPRSLVALLDVLEHEELEIVVVNVENDPGVADAARGHRLVGLAENRGYAAAVNAGARVAGAEIVVFLNDDARITAA